MSEYEAYERGVNAGLGWALAGGPERAPEPENPYANYRTALAKIAYYVYEDHARSDYEHESTLQTCQRRGGTLDTISDIILDVDETLFDEWGPNA